MSGFLILMSSKLCDIYYSCFLSRNDKKTIQNYPIRPETLIELNTLSDTRNMPEFLIEVNKLQLRATCNN